MVRPSAKDGSDLNTQIHKPSSKGDAEGQSAAEAKRAVEATTEATAKKATESHNEAQKFVEGGTPTMDEVSEAMVSTSVRPSSCEEMRACRFRFQAHHFASSTNSFIICSRCSSDLDRIQYLSAHVKLPS